MQHPCLKQQHRHIATVAACSHAGRVLDAARCRLAYRFARGPAPHTVALFRGQAGASHTLLLQRLRSRITKQRCRHASLGLV